MKKLFSIFFVLIFLFNAVGYFIAFKTIQFQIKSEVINKIQMGLTPDELCIINIPKSELKNIKWFEDKKEMSYNGNMYDIVKWKENKNSISYYCLDDSKETLLFTNLDEHINTHIANSPLKSNNAKKMFDHVVKVYFSNYHPHQFTFQTIPNLFCTIYNNNFQSESLPIISPPPQSI